MTKTQFSDGNDWKSELDPARDPNELLAVLEELSSQEGVAGVAQVCLRLLAHDDSQVRVWAAEALESAAQPDGGETNELTLWLNQLLDQQAAAAKKPFVWPTASNAHQPQKKASSGPDEELVASLLADQLYWTATMLGRIGADARSADATLARLESLAGDAQAEAFHAAAARAAAMRRRISS